MGKQGSQTDSEVIGAGSRPICYDGEALRAEVGRLLAALRARLSTEPYRDLLGENVVAGLEADALAITDHLGSPFRIVVVGDFKRGKSSLINAMLRQPLLSVDVLPETLAITEVRYGATFNARLVMKDGGFLPIKSDELHRQTIEPLIEKYANQIDHLCIALPMQGLEGVVWVDTPGTGDIFRCIEDAVAAYLDRSDVVIGVLSPHSPLSQSEQTFFRQVLAPRYFPKLCFVLNMLDHVRQPGDRKRLVDEVRGRLSRSFPGAQHFALSVLDEQARQAGTSRPLPDAAAEFAAGFDLFRESMEETISYQRDAIQAQRVLDLANKLLVSIADRVDLLRAGLAAHESEVAAVIAAQTVCRRDIAVNREQREREAQDLLARLARQASGWMSAFVDRLFAAVAAQASRLDDGQVQRHMLFFVADALRQAVAACAEVQIPVVRHFLSSSPGAEATGRASLTIPTTLSQGISKVTFTDLDWDSSHLLHLMAERFLLEGASLLSGLFGGLNGKAGQDESAKAIQGLLDRRSELLTAVSETLDAVYAKLGSALSRELDACYDEKLSAVDDMLRQAQVLQAQSSVDRSDHERTMRYLAAEIVTFQQTLDSIRQRFMIAGKPAEGSETGE